MLPEPHKGDPERVDVEGQDPSPRIAGQVFGVNSLHWLIDHY